jgi:hypothetical protein
MVFRYMRQAILDVEHGKSLTRIGPIRSHAWGNEEAVARCSRIQADGNMQGDVGDEV